MTVAVAVYERDKPDIDQEDYAGHFTGIYIPLDVPIHLSTRKL